MSCYSCHSQSYACSQAAFTCNKQSFSIQNSGSCGLTSLNPPIPAHYFNLYCQTFCPPVVRPNPSPNHGISCNAYNGYSPATCITLPGHMPSCPGCSNYCQEAYTN